MYKYNLKSHCVDEQPTIENPDNEIYTENWRSRKLREYKEHIASLRSIPVSGKVSWEHGEDVTGKFEEMDTNKWFWVICNKCGWQGSSEKLEGAGQIADTGDYGDGSCPKCLSKDIDTDDSCEVYAGIVAIPIKQEQPQFETGAEYDAYQKGRDDECQSKEQQPIEKDWEDIFEMFQSTTDFVNSYAEVDYNNLKKWLKENYCPPLSQQAEPVRDIERIFERIIEEKDEFFDHDRDKKGEYAWVTNPDKIFTVKQAMKELKASTQQAEQPESAEPRPHLIGWECPRCRTVHSPYTTTCGCQPPTITTTEIKVPQWLIDTQQGKEGGVKDFKPLEEIGTLRDCLYEYGKYFWEYFKNGNPLPGYSGNIEVECVEDFINDMKEQPFIKNQEQQGKELFEWVKASEHGLPEREHKKIISILYKSVPNIIICLDNKWYWLDEKGGKKYHVNTESLSEIEWLKPVKLINQQGNVSDAEKDLIIAGIEEGSEMWKAEYDNCRAILTELVEIKKSKNISHYMGKQPRAWEKAFLFLEKYQHL